jgi:hypothetical protein
VDLAKVWLVDAESAIASCGGGTLGEPLPLPSCFSGTKEMAGEGGTDGSLSGMFALPWSLQ